MRRGVLAEAPSTPPAISAAYRRPVFSFAFNPLSIGDFFSSDLKRVASSGSEMVRNTVARSFQTSGTPGRRVVAALAWVTARSCAIILQEQMGNVEMHLGDVRVVAKDSTERFERLFIPAFVLELACPPRNIFLMSSLVLVSIC